MLTLRCARTILRSASSSASWAVLSWAVLSWAVLPGASLSAAVALFALASSPVHADDLEVSGCVGSRYSITCVTRWGAYGDPYIRLVHPATEADKARSADHERKWQEHCHPTVFQDHYGVARYEYAAPGCEFGVIE